MQLYGSLLAIDCAVFAFVDPRSADAHWLIIGYALLGLTLFGLSGLVASALRSYGEAVHIIGKRLLRYAALIAVLMIGLQSVGQLSLRDVSVLTAFGIGAYLYFGYGKRFALQNA